MPRQAATLDKNEANIAKDLTTAKQDGKVTSTEKKYIKKEVKNNQDVRKNMEKSTKDMKETDEIMRDCKSPVTKSNPTTAPALVK